ncbi:MAG: MoaD/ThiS family protein [Rhodospirillaceae bacterium]|jgi:sulfur carrier protein ThiS|nr:MoaD/ThiS family protein [Rhodospirillaceae bacterium]MBT5245013.1 MoaD/ThiS family protein [Rhodospirillaceae bacterium]MBT5561101.1 MoaD/ThiS family protein [Rhodospirillaceae bacterium]MBT6241014.1 MoaD/ThiS family protein [Rhodospirillaceae bacterium]
MKIHLHFIALRMPELPTEGKDELELKEGASLSDALDMLGVSDINSYMTLVNETSIPATERATTVLVEGDTLTLFSPIKGG